MNKSQKKKFKKILILICVKTLRILIFRPQKNNLKQSAITSGKINRS